MHGKEVVDGINTIDKNYIYQGMSNVQLPGSKLFYYQMQMHTITQFGFLNPGAEDGEISVSGISGSIA